MRSTLVIGNVRLVLCVFFAIFEVAKFLPHVSVSVDCADALASLSIALNSWLVFIKWMLVTFKARAMDVCMLDIMKRSHWDVSAM